LWRLLDNSNTSLHPIYVQPYFEVSGHCGKRDQKCIEIISFTLLISHQEKPA
jgi:hypothetical protein